MNYITPAPEGRQIRSDVPLIRSDEEMLVADDRATLTPSQMVEQKLIGMLKSSPLLVSQVQRRLTRSPR